jgi:hypothetical protein
LETAPLWPDIRTAYGFVHRAARILGNEEGNGALYVRRDYRQLLGQMLAHRHQTPFLHQAFCQFVKVSKSYWSGLFECYEQPDLPRTNNDLEQYFGASRYHERRTSGRKSASASTVVRGSVRLIAAAVTRQRPVSAAQLVPRSVPEWRKLRERLELRHQARRQQLRFRRDPEAFLAAIEERLLKPTLPT